MFHKILIANRGEIALRVIRACKEMGIRTVAVYSDVDRESLHVQMADEAFCVGPAPVGASYLNVPNIISAALVSGADAIHPGYGFLSENPGFVDICESHKLTFVGPTSDAIRMMGDKSQARQTMKQAQVPTLPGTTTVSDDETALAFAREHGLPIVIKAVAGGGGKGMRVVHAMDQMERLVAMARAEAQAAFGDDRIYLEKFLGRARHIEIQIVADKHGNCIHLGERDCSMQRRHQKVVEEAPSTVLTPAIRQKMGEAAIAGAVAANYSSVGTIEFLFDEESQRFYFLEMNTRIQVEHPVTELVTGVDLVKLQIAVAAGEPLPMKQADVTWSGHSIECRVTAEDWEHGFRPSTGKISSLVLPGGPGVRVDSHIYAGYKVPPFYDSLLAKVVVHAPTRSEALIRMGRALDEFRLEGVHTTVPFLRRLLTHPDMVQSRFYTTWIEALMKEGGFDRLLQPENLAVGPVMEKRRAARLLALLALYQLEVGGATTALALESVFSSTADEALEGFFGGPGSKKSKKVPPKATDIAADAELRKFVETLVVETWNNRTALDDKIRERTDNWRPERMSRTDLTILRMAVYELTSDRGVPAAITINEAVELAKSFGEDHSGGFVNGILGGMVEPQPEVN